MFKRFLLTGLALALVALAGVGISNYWGDAPDPDASPAAKTPQAETLLSIGDPPQVIDRILRQDAFTEEYQEIIEDLAKTPRGFAGLDVASGYKCYFFKETTSSESYDKHGSVEAALSDAFVWTIPSNSQKIQYSVEEINGTWKISRFPQSVYRPENPNIPPAYGKVDRALLRSTINAHLNEIGATPEDIDCLRYVCEFCFHDLDTNKYVYLKIKGKEYLVPFFANAYFPPDLENGKLYEAEEAMKALRAYWDERNIYPGNQTYGTDNLTNGSAQTL